MLKRILFLIIAAACTSCHRNSYENKDCVTSQSYFPCLKAYYEDVVLKNPDLYPGYSYDTFPYSGRHEYNEVIYYEHDYTLTKEKDGYDAERTFKIAIPRYTDGDGDNYPYSFDNGSLKKDDEYIYTKYTFQYTLQVYVRTPGGYYDNKGYFAVLEAYPGGFGQGYRDEEGEPLASIDRELYDTLKKAVYLTLVDECLKKVDKYCKENEKGIYENGKYKWLNLFPE